MINSYCGEEDNNIAKNIKINIYIYIFIVKYIYIYICQRIDVGRNR